MITHQTLADMLRVSKRTEVSRRSGVSTRTLRRIIAGTHSPTLATAERIVGAIDAIRAGR